MDASESSVSILGEVMPSEHTGRCLAVPAGMSASLYRCADLVALTLSGSIIGTMRDLGTSLRRLVSLRAENCAISGLDGVAALPAVRELFLAFNSISDVTPLLLHDSLEVLDLEANAIGDEDALLQLSTCSRLHTLTLEANLIAERPDYRSSIAASIPQLRTLDDLPLPASRAGGLGSSTPREPSPPQEPRRPMGSAAACPPRYPSGRLVTSASGVAAVDDGATRNTGSARGAAAGDAASSVRGGPPESSLGSSSLDESSAGISVAASLGTGAAAPRGSGASSSGLASRSDTASTVSIGSTPAGGSSLGTHQLLMRSGTAQAVLAGSAARAFPAGVTPSPARAVHSAPYHRPGSAARPGSARPGRGGGPDDSAAAALKDTSSSLTHGDGSAVFVGSAVQSLRQRRASRTQPPLPLPSPADIESDCKSTSALDTTWPGAFPVSSAQGGSSRSALQPSYASGRRDSGAASASSFGSEQSPRPRTSSDFLPGASGGGIALDSRATPLSPAWRRPSVLVAGGAAAEGKDGGGCSAVPPDAELSILDVLDEGRRQDRLSTRRRSDHIVLSSLSPPQPARSATAASSSAGDDGAASVGATTSHPLSQLLAPGFTAPEPGSALGMSDTDLVSLLRRRPKDVPQLHSRESFRRFFAGMPRSRMLDLLRRAFSGALADRPAAEGPPDEGQDSEARVQRRIELLDGVLRDD